MRQIAIVGGRVIDGTGAAPVEPAGVLIAEGRVVEVGPDVHVPEGAEVIDASGMTVMPGVIDCHQHVGFGYAAIRRLQECLRRGVTTVAAVTAGPEGARLRAAIEEGTIEGCARYHVGMVVGCSFGHLRREDANIAGVTADGPWEVRRGVRQMVQAGADFIKTAASGGFQWADEAMNFRNYTLEELSALVEEAHAWNRRVAVHAHGQPGINNAIAAGCDALHHCALLDDEGLRRLAASGLWFVPTLHITSEAVYTRPGLPAHMRPRMERANPIHREGVRRAHQMGVPIAVGTDGGPGDAMHEMMELTACGLSPMEALVAGTRNAADCLGILDQTGTLEPGKCADLLVVRGDPLSDISVLYEESNLALVLRNGLKAVPRQAEL